MNEEGSSIEFATTVVRTLVDAGFQAYWAGGCVRDLLRGMTPNDYDVATSATPEQVRKVFGSRRTLAVGESFGVMIVLGPRGSGEQVEVATFRKEGNYLDGRHPSHVEFCSPEEDAGRRDFTINGMFYDPLTATVHDFVGGQLDLQKKIIRAIGNPCDRMTEDKLRMLRAIRFAAAFDFALDPETARSVTEMANEIAVVSAERIGQELRKMLRSPQRARAVGLLFELGLMRTILPEVLEYTIDVSKSRWESTQVVLAKLGEASFEMSMALLLQDVPIDESKQGQTTHSVAAICRRLRLSNEETNHICWLREHKGTLGSLSTDSLARTKRLVVQRYFQDLLKLERTIALVNNRNLEPYEWVDEFLRKTPAEEINPPELLTGRDLLAQGYQPGPHFKVWLTAIRDAQLNREIETKEDAIVLLHKLADAETGE